MTLRQLCKKSRKSRYNSVHKNYSGMGFQLERLGRCSFKKGTCLKIIELKPKKPNSAQRKVTRVILSNGQVVLAHIPGEGHSLTKHNSVLVRGRRVKDLPGVKHRVVRRKYDLSGVVGRVSSRSKYGVKLGR